jgi:molecular chaperone GrpE
MDEKLDSTEETVKDEAKVEEQEVSTEETEKVEVTVEDKLAELEKANAELKDQYLRKCADFDNYRKRMMKEKQDAFDYANTNILTDLVAILDDFDRALAAGVESDGKEKTDLKPVVDGIKMINKQLRGLLEAKYNLSCYGVAGDLFDHDIQEAIAKVEGAVAEPILSEVYLKGYKLKERVIRPAKVMVTMPDGSVSAPESTDTENQQTDSATAEN